MIERKKKSASTAKILMNAPHIYTYFFFLIKINQTRDEIKTLAENLITN